MLVEITICVGPSGPYLGFRIKFSNAQVELCNTASLKSALKGNTMQRLLSATVHWFPALPAGSSFLRNTQVTACSRNAAKGARCTWNRSLVVTAPEGTELFLNSQLESTWITFRRRACFPSKTLAKSSQLSRMICTFPRTRNFERSPHWYQGSRTYNVNG